MRKLLVANRGEIARRVFRTARGLGISTVAVYSDADEGGAHVAEADEAVRLRGATPAETYLRGDLIVAAARAVGADAVHPGYGFLSENAEFANACGAAGLVFVGPPPGAIAAMGDKLEAKERMSEAGVPVLPSTTDPARAATDVGFPLLVKAVYGGGGRGMRVVASVGELEEAVDAARREATAAFGDGTVFLERLVPAPRHVEVQIFGDTHGNVIHLFERECSIQRRHQKVIEEAPSPAVDEALRSEICAAAVAAGKAIGYVNAGTVEFVLEPDGRFWFLEVNTRLQVEHPVTELITGLDLVELQLAVAEGAPLPPAAVDAARDGHAVEARLYAEDALADFMPVSGPVHRFRIPEGDGVRVDAGYVDGSVVSTHYDAMLAKVIAWAPTRRAAIDRLAAALAGAEIHGVVTNRDLLVATLRHPEFAEGRFDTGFFDRHPPAELVRPTSDEVHRVHATVAARATTERDRSGSPQPAGLPLNWRNVGPADLRVAFEVDGRRVEVDLAAGDDAVDVQRRYRVQFADGVWYVDSTLGSSAFREIPRFPLPEAAVATGSLLAALPGSVVRLLVAAGDAVHAGQELLALEAMKMEHAVRAPHDGVVSEVRVAVGDQVEPGAVLLVVETAE